MCGIIGYVGHREAAPILLDGLQRLEYRGYDSAGICLREGGSLRLSKRKGRLEALADVVVASEARMGIGHTRWATHGAPTDANAHPHADCSGTIAVVHNGIIENHHALRTLLEEEGHVFSSETDSEVLSHLIEKFYEGDLAPAVHKALALVEGAFGLVAMHADEPVLVAARNGSPLVIGLGREEMLIASDVTALLPHTRKVIYLEDDELVVLDPATHVVTNRKGEHMQKEVETVRWRAEQAEKGAFKHFMRKEIQEQPEALRNTLRGRIAAQRIKLSLDIDAQDIRRIVIVACGTSWHSGLIGKHLIERWTDIPVEVDYASEFRYRDPLLTPQDLVVAISQSGETADTLAAIREARKKGARLVGIVNVVGSTITREVDCGIYLHAGPEIGVASTKAFTCQVAALTLLALWLRQERGDEVPKQVLSELERLPERIEDMLAMDDEIRLCARMFADAPNFLFLGRGVNFPVALEGALKLKEISYIHAEGYPAAELKHGPIALIDEQMPVFFIAPKDHTYPKILSNMQEVCARGGRIIALVTEEDPALEGLCHAVLPIPSTLEILSPILTSIPLQLFAYHVADLRGLNVDKPRNLAKSVTVE